MELTEFILYAVLPLLLLAYYVIKKKYSYFEDREIPFVKPSLLFGNMSGVSTKIHFIDAFQKVYDECKTKNVIAGFFTFFSPQIIVTDLELTKLILIKDFNNFMDRGVYHNEENEPMTGNLFFLEGERWRFLRNKLSPTFTSGKIKMMYGTIESKGKDLIKAIEKVSNFGSIDVKDITNRFTTDVISSCAFGLETDTLDYKNPDISEIAKLVFSPAGLNILRLFFIFAFQDLAKRLNMRQFSKKVEDYFMNIVGSSMEYRENNNIERKDFLNMLIQLKNKGSIDGEVSTDSRKLTFNECVAQAFIFFLAGSDTSSVAISFTIMELSFNQEIQEKLRNEILEKSKESDGNITYENLQEMIYLNHVINETLRKDPPAPFLVRKAKEDYKIPNTNQTIPKDFRIMIPTICFQNDERYWKNPEEFNPDRFTPEESANRPNEAFLPFGDGPRNCIGNRFALVNVKFAVATIIKNFKVTPDATKVQYPFKFNPKNPNIEPKGGFHVNFERI